MALFLQTLLCGAQTSYNEKYAKVLEHFSNDSLKKKAAAFLIDNMDGHSSPESNSIKLYTDKIMSMWPKTAPKYLDATWDECKGTERVSYVPDSMLINNAMLIDYIDDAFIDWRESPWRDDITFTQFCDYILPYRVKNERLSKAWRKKLREKYQHLIAGVKDMKTAFEIVSDSVKKELRYWTPTSYPYPFTSTLTVAFDLPQNEPDVMLYLYDQYGINVCNYSLGTLSQGQHSFNISPEVMPGIYMIRIKAGTEQFKTIFTRKGGF